MSPSLHYYYFFYLPLTAYHLNFFGENVVPQFYSKTYASHHENPKIRKDRNEKFPILFQKNVVLKRDGHVSCKISPFAIDDFLN